MSTIQIAFVLFAAIAAGGLLLAGLIAAKAPFPGFFGPAHGIGALVALAVLLYANITGDATPDRAWWAFGVFAAGLVGGFTLFRVLFRKRAPLWMIAGHGSLGAVGLYLLYGAAF